MWFYSLVWVLLKEMEGVSIIAGLVWWSVVVLGWMYRRVRMLCSYVMFLCCVRVARWAGSIVVFKSCDVLIDAVARVLWYFGGCCRSGAVLSRGRPRPFVVMCCLVEDLVFS